MEEELHDFLKENLKMDREALEDLGQVVIKKQRGRPGASNKEEVIVMFENKDVRDSVKAMGPNLANYGDSAGMRLHLPDHLQKDFKVLINLAYDLKTKHKELRRNVKFDVETLGLFMDMQLTTTGDWKRVYPAQARMALSTSKNTRSGPINLDDEDLRSLLGEEECNE